MFWEFWHFGIPMLAALWAPDLQRVWAFPSPDDRQALAFPDVQAVLPHATESGDLDA